MAVTNAPPTVVLMYHGLGTPDSPGNHQSGNYSGDSLRNHSGSRHAGRFNSLFDRDDLQYVVDTTDFRNQMTCIAQKGIPVFMPGKPAEDRPHAITAGSSRVSARLVITFDDGHRSNHSIALPLLKELGLKAVFFITTDWIGRDGYMTGEMIRELHTSGMAVGSHGCSHGFFPDMTPEKVYDELKRSKSRLEEITGASIDSFSAPGGRIDSRIVEMAKDTGYAWIYDSRPVVNRSIAAGRPAGRFAVTRGRRMDWFAAVVSASPPAGEKIRYGFLLCIKKLLGNRRYENIRNKLLKG